MWSSILDWFRHTGTATSRGTSHTHQRPWYIVLCLTGVDYFSSLAYQPGIALLAVGAIAPFATGALILVTLLCALPVYAIVARRSYVGQGSIAMLESLLSGWWSKFLVLVLLGFAATDFVITMTLSSADAATHAIENPFLSPFVGHAQISITLGLLFVLALVFLKGFSEAIGVAAAVAIPYLILNLIVLGRGLFEIVTHPSVFTNWEKALFAHHNWNSILIAAAILFPKLALGLSGFETGVAVMPLIEGGKGDPVDTDEDLEIDPDSEARLPKGRIRNTQKLLISAGLIMSVYLLLSSIVTSVLIPESAYREGGDASGRAIAYLAHQYLGNAFGTLYDISTIAILWFAGASAMAGLLNLIPRYLPRFGMAPRWIVYRRPLVVVLFVITVIITLIFQASVEKQGGAYATGVLVLMLSAAFAASVQQWRSKVYGIALYCSLVTLIFLYTTIANVIERPDGILIALAFIVTLIVVSVASRYSRLTELRISGQRFASAESERVWNELTKQKVNLVPINSISDENKEDKLREIRYYYKVTGKIAFVNVKLLNNRSEFFGDVRISVRDTGMYFMIQVTQAIAIANTIAYLSTQLKPRCVFLGLTHRDPMDQALRYFLWGEGETGMMVYTILQRYWEEHGDDPDRPLLFLLVDHPKQLAEVTASQ